MRQVSCNVGSGQRPFTSTPEMHWINIDKLERSDMPKPDMVCDGAEIPLQDESIDYYVLHHCLEHANCGGGTGMVKEAHRLLRPNGSLIVTVPNLRALAERWLAGGLSTQIYVTNLYGAWMGSDEDYHHWGYDEASLLEFLASCILWSEVKLFDWREIPGASICRDWWILGVECIK